MTTPDVLDDDGLSGMWKARALRAEAAVEKLESYCFGLETQTRGFRPRVIRELFASILRARAVENDGPKNYEDFQQRRGRLPDLIEEAISIYDGFMADDDYDAQRCLDRVVEHLKTARDFYDNKQGEAGEGGE